jgi:hypothetical protein
VAKHIALTVDRYQAETFLKAVRTKRDIILVWMNAIKAFLVNQAAPEAQTVAVISLSVMSMSRLFCELEDGRKIFSISFPFSLRITDDQILFYSRSGVLVDSRVSSQLIALVETGGVLEEPDFLRFVDPILDAIEMDPSLWVLLRELMLAEDSYVRYDWDSAGINGHLHPEHHLDFAYSSSSSFKLGLNARVSRDTLMGILDVDSDCHYLHAPPIK